MAFLYGLIYAIVFILLSLPLFKVYQLEGYKVKNFIKKISHFNFAFGDKNKINFTKRLKRCIFCDFLIIFIVFSLIFYFLNYFYVYIIMIFAGVLMLPCFLIISHFLCLPIEKLITNSYIKKAKVKLQNMPCKKIAITGSFGKTSTKNILFQILSQKYKVCATPKSYNTPMGICKTILENLTEKDDFFIVEMGARHEGDIAFLCKLVGADFGILTPVGNCHIETFKTLENVEKTKFEICENVKSLMIISSKSASNRKLYEKCEKKKYLISDENSFAYANNIHFKDFKTHFDLHIDEKVISVSTNLLGKVNVDNIVLASALAYLLGVNLLDIKKGISELKSVPHRMELIKGFANVIDDSYNSNFVGFKEALNTIASFEGDKILVTPGMVELGDKQYEMNFKIGQEISKVCDYVIIMNKTNSSALTEGLLNKGFNRKNIFYANTRLEQKEILKKLVKKGDIVLFENDLPDNYN